MYFEPICEVMYALNIAIRVGEDDDFVAKCYETL